MTVDVARPRVASAWPGVDVVLSDRYQLLQFLAPGPAAAVWRARDLQLDRDVAVKVLYPYLLEDEVAIARFRVEALATARLVHPNVVQLFDAAADDTYSYLVLEYVSGGVLADFEGTRLHPGVVAALGCQVAAGLAAAHDVPLVHRDIRPENILIARSGRVKLTDFGLAKDLRQDLQLTLGESVIGAVRFLAPEQLLGGPACPASDVYALGLVLWTACTGRLPFSTAELLRGAPERLEREPEPVRRITPDVPAELEAIIRQATRMDPADRYAHAREMATALHEITGPRAHEATRVLAATEP